jgi:hypothetical protein
VDSDDVLLNIMAIKETAVPFEELGVFRMGRLGQHDGEDTLSDRRVGGIRRSDRKRFVVVVDLPDDPLIRDRKNRAIVLSIGVVTGIPMPAS